MLNELFDKNGFAFRFHAANFRIKRLSHSKMKCLAMQEARNPRKKRAMTPSSIFRNVAALITAASCVCTAACLIGPTAQAQERATATVKVADSDATESTIALYSRLSNSNGRIIFGHQQDTDNHVTSDIENQGTNSDVYALIGEYPGMSAQDTGTETDYMKLAQSAIDTDAHGGIMTFSSHWDNPATGGDYSDTTRVVDRILPGGDLNAAFNQQLDVVANMALNAKRSDGTSIPIIYRPLHENDGGWFWWGAGHATNGEYIELYRYIVEYLRDVKNVHNLLYAYCGYTMDAYPGDDFVDIIGTDTYDNETTLDASRSWIQTTVKRIETTVDWADSHGKIPALTEFGKLMHKSDSDTVNPHWFTELLAAIKSSPKASRIAYMMTWANWGEDQCWTPWPGTAIADDFRNFANDPAIVMASGTPIDYSTNIKAASQTPSVRIVNPTERQRLTGDRTTIYARVSGNPNVSHVSLKIEGDDSTYSMTKNADNYYVIEWPMNPALQDNKLHVMTVTAATDRGILTGSTSVILSEQFVQERDVVDDFDNYSDDVDLKQTWAPNNLASSRFYLSENKGHGNALTIDWDFNDSPGYLGVGRGLSDGTDWSDFNALSLYVKSKANGHKFVLQLKAGDVTFEAYPSLEKDVDGTLVIPFSQFTPASWESTENKGKQLTSDLLRKISSFSIYLNDGDKEFAESWSGGTRPRSGTIAVDSIHCIKTDETGGSGSIENGGGNSGTSGGTNAGTTGDKDQNHDASEAPVKKNVDTVAKTGAAVCVPLIVLVASAIVAVAIMKRRRGV